MRDAEQRWRQARALLARAAQRESWAETPADMAAVLGLERQATRALAAAERAERLAQQGPAPRQQAPLPWLRGDLAVKAQPGQGGARRWDEGAVPQRQGDGGHHRD